MTDPRLHRHPLGFLQVRDMPSEEEIRTYYQEKYYQTERSNYRQTYSTEEIRWFRLRAERVLAAVERVRGPSVGRMLDVGCGEGFAMDRLAAAGWQVEGLDYSSAGLEAMNPHLRHALCVGDVRDLLEQRLASGARYDLVWLSNVLEHASDPPALLQRLRGVIAPGGACVVVVPNDGSEVQEHLVNTGDIDRRFWVVVPDHLAYFNYDTLRSTVEGCGWTCRLMMGEFPIDWFLFHPASNYVMRKDAGPGAHRARLELDLLLGARPMQDVLDFYVAMAGVGMGRQIVAVLT